MHFGDPIHIKDAYVEILVYKHEILDYYVNEKSYDYQLCSIYECKYVDIRDIRRLYEDFEFGDDVERDFRVCKKFKAETFYKVRFVYDKRSSLKIDGFMEVTQDMHKEDPFLGLH